MSYKGCIALDIDGTITENKFYVPPEIASYLKYLQEDGWLIILSTGRTHAFAKKILESLSLPFIFCGQNGSVAIQYPPKEILFKRYLTLDVISVIEEAFEGISGNFIVYSGFENDDACYYRKSSFTDHDLQYIHELQSRQSEQWIKTNQFNAKTFSSFPLVKCFGSRIAMQRLQNKICSLDGFENALVQDPFNKDYSLLLITANGVSKGTALKKIIDEQKITKCIAAGDDENDASLIQIANIKIVIDTAPKFLIELADIVSKPPSELGIIEALKKAIQ